MVHSGSRIISDHILTDSPSFLPWNPLPLISARRDDTSFVGVTDRRGFMCMALIPEYIWEEM